MNSNLVEVVEKQSSVISIQAGVIICGYKKACYALPRASKRKV